MKTTESMPPISRRSLVEAIVASTIGTTIEWYDFFLYGTAAALVFPRLFFPEADEFTGQILAFSTFTVGFVARPLGGVIFGYMGDRVGRKSALVTTLLLMGFSTLLIGFLPTYAEIGVLAPLRRKAHAREAVERARFGRDAPHSGLRSISGLSSSSIR